MSTKRLQILKTSLDKKENLFSSKLNNHFATVKLANGQPLNDKRNGQSTLNKWDRQNNALRTLDKSIETTKEAIEKETGKIEYVEAIKAQLPEAIVDLINNGTLVQWRKYPYMFFVNGVEKARIIWDLDAKVLKHKFATSVPNQEQYSVFAKTFNSLKKIVNP